MWLAQSLLLELQASGGRGYLSNSTSGFIRRWNGAFLPIVSQSAVQLRHIILGFIEMKAKPVTDLISRMDIKTMMQKSHCKQLTVL